MDKKELIEFEEMIKDLFLDKKIRSPVHLSNGNEEELIRIFKKIKKDDWVFSTHRSHYHALLKGIDKNWLKNEILNNRSIHIINKEHNFFSSAIMGGILPIALGVALAMHREKSENWVWVFVGDMTSTMGVFHECIKYASSVYGLHINFVVEDNGLSIKSPTEKVWGKYDSVYIYRYKYKSVYPHQGCGEWVIF